MVRGIDKFKEFFMDFQDQYVLIGGVACDLIFEERDLTFRATRDFDMVLIVEALTPEFGVQFWNFIVDVGYENRAKSDVARIVATLTGNERCEVPKNIYNDMEQFIKEFEKEPPDMKALKIPAVTVTDIVNILYEIYIIG